jgi:eukaryotic-like serine/threonine-protein kinase
MPPLTNGFSKSATAVTGRVRAFARSMAVTNVFLLKQLWIWPILAAVGLGAIGYFLRVAVERTLQNQLAENLQTILNADIAALNNWATFHKAIVRAVAQDDDVVEAVRAMRVVSGRPGATQLDLLKSDELAALRAVLAPVIETYGHDGFVVLDEQRTVIAAMRNELVGMSARDEDLESLVQRIRDGSAVISPPHKSEIVLSDDRGNRRAQVPTMFALAPVKDADGNGIAVLGLRIRPWDEFTRILQVARFGESGETYAFDRNGTLLSQSRFDKDLKKLGLLPEDAESILNLQIRDPGVDLTAGGRTDKLRSEQPLTRMAAAAVAGENGVDVSGYRDYRGVPVVGAWQWLDEEGYGIATEVDAAEAFETLFILRRVFWSMFGLLGIGSVAIFIFSVSVARWKRRAHKATLEAKQLGQYTLDEKLGEGGMGVVYRAHHAMLHRPTAVKFLDSSKTNDLSLGRFEREVQLTGRLNHPNTIVVYDYGRTPDGVFYYAMEYLDGISLEELVEKFGLLPEGRVIHILQQVCGSLAEAHGLGMVHRDIKPGNIMVNRRGGMYDFVKVLDFGLARAVDTSRAAGLTAAGTITGTPLYMSPESIERPESIDARSDLYALGAVAYFLLTGTPVFDGSSVIEIIQHHVKTLPESMSERAGRRISDDMEAIVMKLLEKSPDARFQTAEDVAQSLGRCAALGKWTHVEARNWWNRFYPETSEQTGPAGQSELDTGSTVVTVPVARN